MWDLYGPVLIHVGPMWIHGDLCGSLYAHMDLCGSNVNLFGSRVDLSGLCVGPYELV